MAAKYPLRNLDQHPGLTPDLLRAAYTEMCMVRCHVERVVQECSKGNIKFAIWGPGEELHGAAEAIAFNDVVNPEAFAICGHYRSAGLLSMWSRLRGYHDFHLDHMRQQLSRSTDPWSGGRQMTAHFNDMRHNTLPVQSALGMQIGKSVGYAHGLRQKGVEDGVVVTVLGDGTTAEGDVHDGMNGASVLQLPLLMMITDNKIAISVKPDDGRGIKDFEAYAKAFGFEFFTADGNDFMDVYETSKAAATYCRDEQRPALFWVRELSRLNGHSNAGIYNFMFDQHDCINDFGEALVDAGIAKPDEIVRRVEGTGKDYFKRHELGSLGGDADAYIRQTMEIAGGEPEPQPDSIYEHIYDPYPEVEELGPVGRQTVISLNGAVRAAMRDILTENPMAWIYGQDVAARGGVMQATGGLWERFPNQVKDSPINEPLILGAAVGFALHDGATALPEIQFSDYSLNTLHWLVYMGNLLWTSNGTARANVIVRLPVEPLHGGAVYHSMCMEGLYGAIPGLTIVAPTTTRDFYGLLRSAADYSGPVVFLESKGLYRMALGDAFPNEPTDPDEVKQLKRAIFLEGKIPDLPRDYRTPFQRAAVRRQGTDLTVVTWGRCTIFAAQAVQRLADEDGISAELIDLRTIVPPDMDTVLASARKTGRLLVVHEDRVFASLGREIQGQVVEATQGEGVVTRVLGQLPVPGIPQNIALEHFITVSPEKVYAAAKELLAAKASVAAAPEQTRPAPSAPTPLRTQVLWTPNRNYTA